MAYTPIYTPKNFTDWGPPDLDASNLNDIEAALVSLGNGLQTAAADTDTNTAAITTINGEISDLNDLIDEILPDDSESGNPAVITDAFAGECKSLVLTLEPIQSGSGTPSPANPRPITGRTQSTATRTGKNAWNDADSMLQRMSRNGATYTNTETDTKTAFNARVELMFSSSPAYASTVTTISSAGRYSIVVDTTNITYDHFRLKHNGSVRDLIISLPFSVKGQLIISFDVDGYNPSVVGGLVIKNIQIEVGSTATPYEPYDAESITEAYGQTVYGASVDITGGEALKTKDIYIPVVTTVGYSGDAGTWYADCYGVTIVEDTPVLCNMYDRVDHGLAGADGKFKVYANAFTFYDARFTTIENAQSVLNSCRVVYPLAIPVSISLTPQNLTLLKGDNVITTDADNVEVDYKADIALYIAKQLGGNLGNRGAKSAPVEEPADDPKEEEKTDEKIIEPVTKEAIK